MSNGKSRAVLLLYQTKTDVAGKLIASFRDRFTQGHLFLAYHAAFPMALTPDLLYRLWKNFQRDIHQNKQDIPWEAVADLLLSPLCKEVGYELYQMDADVRTILLSDLKANHHLGEDRINDLARFLLKYIQQQTHTDPDLAQAQKLVALSYVEPTQAAHELAALIHEKASAILNQPADNGGQGAEMVRMGSLLNTLTEPLTDKQRTEFTPLLTYVEGLTHFVRGDATQAADQFSKIAEGMVIHVLGEQLPVPGQVQVEIQKRQNIQFSSSHQTDKERAEERFQSAVTGLGDEKESAGIDASSRQTDKERAEEQKQRAEERFQSAVTGLGDEKESAKISAAILLQTFLRPGYEQFYTQIFDLAVANLRLIRTSHPPEDPNAPQHLTPLSQALIDVFKEAFPLARSQNNRSPQSLNATGIQLDNAYLRGSDLKRVWMPRASLRIADLSEADLSGAMLSEADLSGAMLRGADLSEADLSEANLSGAMLSEANLSGAYLSEARLSGAMLSKADLSGAMLRGADLSETDLRGVKMNNETDLRGTNLQGAKYNTKVMQEKEAQGKLVTIEPTQWPQGFDPDGAVDEVPMTSSSQFTVSPPPPSQSNDAQAQSASSAQESIPTPDTGGRSAPSQQGPLEEDRRQRLYSSITCVVTIHGVAFQQAPREGVAGYADHLHTHLCRELNKDGVELLSDDPDRRSNQMGDSAPIYVESVWPPESFYREAGLKRLGSWEEDHRVLSVADAPLVERNAPIAHIALVYSDLRPEISTDADPNYGHVKVLVHKALTPSSKLKEGRNILARIEDDIATYVVNNRERERVRSFVSDAILRLVYREDVGAIVLNCNGNGTVIALDVLHQLPLLAIKKIKTFITVGSPLRKYTTLFQWGRELEMASTFPEWLNFWDQRDPVADPLTPSFGWQRGERSTPEQMTGLFVGLDPNTGALTPLLIRDILVDNLAHSKGGGLQAFNYWDNEKEFVNPLADILLAIVSDVQMWA